MPELLCVHAVGARIGIDLDGLDRDLATAIERAWADAVYAGDEPVDVTVTVRPGDPSRVLESLSQQVTLAAIEAGRGSVWMLHAAGVAGQSGDVVVLVGPSGRGKTTASRALGQIFGYVSDETIAIDRSGGVRPYRKPLSVIEDRGRPKVQVAPSEAGLKPLPGAPLRVRAIVLLDRDPAHTGPPMLEPADLGDALEELVAQSSFLVNADAPLRDIAAVAEATGGVLRVAYAEATDLAPVIRELLAPGLPPVRVAPATASDRRTPGTAPGSAEHGTPRFSRAPSADDIDLDDPDRIAILTVDEHSRGTVHVIAGIAPALWRAADAATLDELVDVAVAAYGTPEDHDPRPAVLTAVGALLNAGLLISDEARVRRRDDVTRADRDDRVPALALGDGAAQPRLLADAAAVIWDWLEEPTTVTQLAARAIDESGVSDPQVAADVEAYVGDLIASQLVERLD